MLAKLTSGTVVRFKGNPMRLRNRFGVVVEDEGPHGALRLKIEGSDSALVSRHEVSVPKNPPAIPLRGLRQRLPYGKWTCEDGREVVFNRDYKPIWQRRPGQRAQDANSAEWVRFVRQEWFYDDRNTPWRERDTELKCNRILEYWGLPTV